MPKDVESKKKSLRLSFKGDAEARKKRKRNHHHRHYDRQARSSGVREPGDSDAEQYGGNDQGVHAFSTGLCDLQRV